MLTAFLLVLVGALGAVGGYFARELKEILKRIELALRVLVQRQQQEEAQEVAKKRGMSFGAPMSMVELAEMEDEERIEALNKSM